jgi:hypothetical protein
MSGKRPVLPSPHPCGTSHAAAVAAGPKPEPDAELAEALARMLATAGVRVRRA